MPPETLRFHNPLANGATRSASKQSTRKAIKTQDRENHKSSEGGKKKVSS